MKKAKYSILILVIFIMFLTGSIYAWFELTQTQDLDLEPGAFDIEIDVLFNDVSVTTMDEYYDDETGIITVNAHDNSADNYINDLKIVINVSTHNSTRLRVRVQDEWIVIRDYFAGNQTIRVIPGNVVNDEVVVPFNVHEDFFQVDGDPHFYYNGLIEGSDALDIIFINGGIHRAMRTTDTFVETFYVRITIYVDVVQANRFVELWNVNANIFD